MTLRHILIFLTAAVLYLAILPRSWRRWVLFSGSVMAMYWLQPLTRIAKLDFVFPTATLALVALAWLVTRRAGQPFTRQDGIAAGVMVGLVVALSFGRYIVPELRVTPSRPPAPEIVVAWLAAIVAVLLLVDRLPVGRSRLALVSALVILGLFAILKTEALAEQASRVLRVWQGQDPDLARSEELRWLGFSYIAFRLIHTLRDRKTGQLPALSLRDYVTYVIFFPALTAGPIDRAERFLTDWQVLAGPEPGQCVQGGMRIAIGIGKKFVIADSLATFALNATRAEQAVSSAALWVLLYAYAFQIYFDFSGYSDIAIGLGQLFGIKLPENFRQPYLARNITAFWQSWHITLSQWVRFYVFSPLSRYLLTRRRKPSPLALAFVGQLATMIVIGLWHGVTWNFIAWGLWHGLGLFVHKAWSDRTRRTYLAGVLVTFHFVVVGWLWFALPDMQTGWDVFTRLFEVFA